MNTGDYAARIAKARSLMKQDNDAAASKIYEDLIKQAPDLPQAYNNLAAIKARHGDYKQAQALLEQALRSNPVYATIYENLSTIYVEMARDSYGKALSLDTPQKTLALRELSGPKKVKPAPPPIQVATVAAHKPAAAVASAASKPVAKPEKPVPVANKPSQGQETQQPATIAKTEVPIPKPTAKPSPPSETPASPDVTPARTAPAETPAPKRAAVESRPVITKPDSQEAGVAAAANVKTDNAVYKDKIITDLQSWAAAWSNKAVDAYLGFYSDDYAPRGMTHPQWVAQRRQRLMAPKWIQVALNDFEIGPVKDGVVRVRFIQEYKADNYQDKTRKLIRLRKTAAGWRIVDEKNLVKLH